MGIFGPFDLMLDQKRMQTRCVGGFFCYVGTGVPKLLLPPEIIRIFGPKKATFGPKLTFWAKYWHFWPTSFAL